MNLKMVAFNQALTGEQLNPKVKYFTANAGLNFSHMVGEKFSYTN
jgi:hypothetical protein